MAPAHGDVKSGELGTLGAVAPLVTAAALLPLVPWYRDMDASEVVLSVLHIAACCLGASVAVYRGLRPGLLVASVFPYCWLAVPAVYQISHVQAAWSDPGVTLDTSATLRALAIVAVGQGALVTCYGLARLRGPRSAHTWKVTGSGRTRLACLAGLMLLGTLLLIPFVVSAAGGIGALFSSRQGFNEALRDNGYTDYASPTAALGKLVPGAFATVATLLGLYLYRTRQVATPANRRAALAICLLGLGLLCIVANPFAFSRFLFLTSFGPVVLVLLNPRGRRAAVVWLVGCVMAFLLAYPAADLLRRENASGAAVTADLLASKDYDGFQQVVNTVNLVDDQGIAWGSHVVSAGLFFVPRDFWPAKAVPASVTVAEHRGYTFTNLSLPAPAEAYLDGGWVGVALLMGLLGLVLSVLDGAWQSGSRWSLVAAYLAMAQVGLWRGPFGSQTPVFGFALGLLVISMLLAVEAREQHSTNHSPDESRSVPDVELQDQTSTAARPPSGAEAGRHRARLI